MIKEVIKSLALPKNEILFLHVRLKGLSALPYQEISQQIIGYLEEFFVPKTILIPTYTYSFTKTRVFDRKLSVSEVGRFGEEIRSLYGFEHRTCNPVFSVVDTGKIFTNSIPDDCFSSFGQGSLFYTLSMEGYIMINLNLDVLRPAHLHFIEWYKNVPYRYNKIFAGEIKGDANSKIEYNYFVRDLELNPLWDRLKIRSFLESESVLKIVPSNRNNILWMHSKDMDKVLNKALDSNPNFLLVKS